MKQLFAVFLSMRPHQWTKNLFVFAGIIFSRNLFHFQMVIRVIEAFFVLCIISGACYIFNDIIDIKHDLVHPDKSKRPIASGCLKLRYATIIMIVLTAAAVGWAYCLSLPFCITVVSYFMLQMLYSLILKNIVILDVLSLSIGFVFRVVAGTSIIGVELSPWLVICTVLVALFLALTKRRHELSLLDTSLRFHRPVLTEYNTCLLDQMISVVTASTLVAYSLYTVSEQTTHKFGTTHLVYTIPFVLYGIFRYLYLIYHRKTGSDPSLIFITDIPLAVDILLWIIVSGIIIY